MNVIHDKDGKQSSMRATMFGCFLVASALSIMGVYLNRDLIGLSSLVAMFLGFGIGGKAYQKGKE